MVLVLNEDESGMKWRDERTSLCNFVVILGQVVLLRGDPIENLFGQRMIICNDSETNIYDKYCSIKKQKGGRDRGRKRIRLYESTHLWASEEIWRVADGHGRSD